AQPAADRALRGDPGRDEAGDPAAAQAARAAPRRPRRRARPRPHRGDARAAVRRAGGLPRSRGAARRHAPLPAGRGMSALAGIRVLDLTRFLAGPFCTAILADLGAEVVKIEAPKGGDEGRYGYPPVDGVPVFFLALNRGKKGITLDLRQDEGRALL